MRALRRPLRSLAVMTAAVGVTLGLLATGGAASAAPTRSDGGSKPVIMVHGYSDSGASNCANWSGAISEMRRQKFTGALVTYGYYTGDRNCSFYDATRRSKETHIEDLARGFAKQVYARYSSKGVSVDVVAHSMGGLIARMALYGTRAHLTGFPPYLYIEDVTTLSTPHSGTTGWINIGCTLHQSYQCKQMQGGSVFISMLKSKAQNPQSAIGTDWSLVGSDSDQVVSAASATSMTSGHKYIYNKSSGLGHSDMVSAKASSDAQTASLRYWHTGRTTWGTNTAAEWPAKLSGKASWYWRTW